MNYSADFTYADYLHIYGIFFLVIALSALLIFILRKRIKSLAGASSDSGISVVAKGRIDFSIKYYVVKIKEDSFFIVDNSKSLAITKMNKVYESIE